MVNLTEILFRRSIPRHIHGRYFGPVLYDRTWRKRQVFKLAAHFRGRSRNCFSLAIRKVQRSLQYVRTGRKFRKLNFKYLWERRIQAGTEELGHMPEGSPTMLEGLARSNVLLNRQTLSNLAIWEPRTFAALDKIAAAKAHEEKIARYVGPFPRRILGKL